MSTAQAPDPALVAKAERSIKKLPDTLEDTTLLLAAAISRVDTLALEVAAAENQKILKSLRGKQTQVRNNIERLERRKIKLLKDAATFDDKRKRSADTRPTDLDQAALAKRPHLDEEEASSGDPPPPLTSFGDHPSPLTSDNEDVEMEDGCTKEIEEPRDGAEHLEPGDMEVDADGESDNEGDIDVPEPNVHPSGGAEGDDDDEGSLFSGNDDDVRPGDTLLEGLIRMPEGEETKEETPEVEQPPPDTSTKPPKKRKGKKHHPDSWKILTPAQRDRITTTADNDWDNFHKFRTPFTERTRCWIRREQSLLPGVANHSRALVASCFILGTGRTVCHYHTTSDHGSEINDEAAAEDPDTRYKVTGVPYAPEKAEKKPQGSETEVKTPLYKKEFSHIERPATVKKKGKKGRSKLDPLDPNPNFTLKRVMDFFPKNAAGERYLHCGCLLEEVLVDFHYWKLIQLTSPSTGITEGVGRPLRPRDRQILCYILAQFNMFPFDLYDYNENWEPVAPLDHRRKLVERMARGLRKELKKQEEEQRKKDDEVRKRLEEEARKRAERDTLLLLQFGKGTAGTSDDEDDYSSD